MLRRVVILDDFGVGVVLDVDSVGRSGRAELKAHVGVLVQFATVVISAGLGVSQRLSES